MAERLTLAQLGSIWQVEAEGDTSGFGNMEKFNFLPFISCRILYVFCCSYATDLF